MTVAPLRCIPRRHRRGDRRHASFPIFQCCLEAFDLAASAMADRIGHWRRAAWHLRRRPDLGHPAAGDRYPEEYPPAACGGRGSPRRGISGCAAAQRAWTPDLRNATGRSPLDPDRVGLGGDGCEQPGRVRAKQQDGADETPSWVARLADQSLSSLSCRRWSSHPRLPSWSSWRSSSPPLHLPCLLHRLSPRPGPLR